MATWIGLLRGINVGGKNILPMKELKQLLESLELTNVRTYIQSGNVVFDTRARSSRSLSKTIEDQIESRYGFRPQVLLLEKKDLENSVDSNPFPDAIAEPKSLSFFFLANVPEQPDLAAINDARMPSEHYQLRDRVFYLYAPDGFGRSKLAAKVEKFLGVPATARNYRTVEKLVAMASE